MDVIVSDENAPTKVVRIRILGEEGQAMNPAGGQEGEELGAIKPQAAGESQVKLGVQQPQP